MKTTDIVEAFTRATAVSLTLCAAAVAANEPVAIESAPRPAISAPNRAAAVAPAATQKVQPAAHSLPGASQAAPTAPRRAAQAEPLG